MAKTCVCCGAALGDKARFCKKCGAQAPTGTICRECGAALRKGARFCKYCGAVVYHAAAPVCAYCGAEGSAGDKSCASCGAPLKSAPDIVIPKSPDVEVYITDVPPALTPTCPNCAEQVREGAAFCKKCGAALTEEGGYRPRRPATRAPASKRSAQQRAAAAETTKMKGRRVFPRIVASVLVVAFVITGVRHYNFYWSRVERAFGGYDNGGYTQGDDYGDYADGGVTLSAPFFAGYSEAEIDSAPVAIVGVSPENSAASTGAVTVDFGALNLSGPVTLSVQALPLKTAGDGGTGQEFRFSLTDDSTGAQISEFALPVHITLPKGEGIPMIYYRNPQTGTDELIPSQTDEAAGTVSFATDHFSGFWKSNLKASGAMVESTQYLFHQCGFEPTSPVHFCDAGVDKLICELNLNDIVKAVNTKGMTHEDGVTLFITAADTAMDADEARQFTANLYSTAAQPALKSAATVFRLVGPALLAAKVSYQLYHGSDLTSVILDNGADIVENMLVLCAVVTGAPPLFAAATAVFAANAAYTVFAAEPTIPDDFMYLAYNDFNSNCVYYEVSTDRFIASMTDISGKDVIKLDLGGSETARALRRIYNHNKRDPEQLNRITSTFIERYAGFFFNGADTSVVSVRKRVYEDTAYNASSLLAPRSYKWYTPTQEEEAKYVTKARESLTFSLKPIFDGLTELAFLEGKQELMNVLQNELLPYYNKIAIFELIDPSLQEGASFEASVYADRSKYSIDFATPELRFSNNYSHYYPDLASDPYNFYVTPGSNEVFRCVNYLYWEMSCPTQLRIRKLGVDEQMIYVPFDFNDDGVTRIVLPAPELEPTPTPEPTAEPAPEPTIAANDDYLSGVYYLVDEDVSGGVNLHLTIRGETMTAYLEGVIEYSGSYSSDSHTGVGSYTRDGVTANVEITLHPEGTPVTIDCWFVDYSDIRSSFSLSGRKSG